LAVAGRDDPYLTGAVFSSLHEKNVAVALAAVYARQGDDEALRAIAARMLEMAVAMGEKDAIATALAAIAQPHNGTYSAWQLQAMPGVLEAFARRGAKLEGEQAKAWAQLLATARKIIADDQADESLRIAAAQLLPFADDDTAAADVATLAECLRPQVSPELQSAAVAALGRHTSAEAKRLLVMRWQQLTPTLQIAALDALLARVDATRILLDALESSAIPVGQVDASRRQALANHQDETIKTRAAKLFAAPTRAELAQLIEQYQKSDFTRGNVQQGKLHYARHCAACHRLSGLGHAVGPDLAALSDRSPAYLLQAVLDPNSAVDQRYASYTVATHQGQVFTGMLAAESASSIALKQADGKEQTILRADLEELVNTGKSFMPEGLARDIPPAAMVDLLAFVAAGGVRPTYSFTGNVVPHANYPDDAKQRLTDGDMGDKGFLDGRWIGLAHSHADSRPLIDFNVLGQTTLASVRIVYGVNHRPGAIHAPDRVTISTSTDGKTFAHATTFSAFDDSPDGMGAGELARRVVEIPLARHTARFVRLEFANDGGWTFLSEVTLNAMDHEADGDGESAVEPIAFQSVVSLVAMANEIQSGAKEYDKIPAMFTVAIAAGKRNDGPEVHAILSMALPAVDAPLRDWQAVVVGGGVINGVSQSGDWPIARMEQLLADDEELLARWQRSLELALAMADNEKVPHATRYDALRMVAGLPFDKCETLLKRYVQANAPGELQLGAVSALVDMPDAASTALMIESYGQLAAANRAVVQVGLLRSRDRVTSLLQAIDQKAIDAESISVEVQTRLINHHETQVNTWARRVFRNGNGE
jgi:putative heme-binding domain-containing protein